jgi:hypothetical protein
MEKKVFLHHQHPLLRGKQRGHTLHINNHQRTPARLNRNTLPTPMTRNSIRPRARRWFSRRAGEVPDSRCRFDPTISSSVLQPLISQPRNMEGKWSARLTNYSNSPTDSNSYLVRQRVRYKYRLRTGRLPGLRLGGGTVLRSPTTFSDQTQRRDRKRKIDFGRRGTWELI